MRTACACNCATSSSIWRRVSRAAVREEDANAVVAVLERQLASRLWSKAPSSSVSHCRPAVLDKPRLNDLFEVLVDNALSMPVRLIIPVAAYPHQRRAWRGSEPLPRCPTTGRAFRTEYREAVFEIFERLTAGGEGGSGIGLSIARRIVESRHGRIWIEQADQGGTTVVFELPDAG